MSAADSLTFLCDYASARRPSLQRPRPFGHTSCPANGRVVPEKRDVRSVLSDNFGARRCVWLAWFCVWSLITSLSDSEMM